MTGGPQSAALRGGVTAPPPGWARWTDHIWARVFARSIDEKLLNGGVTDDDPVVIVRRARLIGIRYRSAVAASLRKLAAAARYPELNRFRAQIQLRAKPVIDSEPLILALADELESEETVSPRGVILAERLITDGDSPVYAPIALSKPTEETVDSAVRHARAALHLG
jgi:hypothetical protein